MDDALDNNSSLLPILLVILSSFVELPVVDVKSFSELTLWSGWALESCTSASYEPLPTLQTRPYSPGDRARFDEEVAISSSFKFENLREKNQGSQHIKMINHQMIITGLPMLTSPVLLYSPSHLA